MNRQNICQLGCASNFFPSTPTISGLKHGLLLCTIGLLVGLSSIPASAEHTVLADNAIRSSLQKGLTDLPPLVEENDLPDQVFNGVNRPVRDLILVGIEVVIDESLPSPNVWEFLHSPDPTTNADIAILNIHCQRLIVRGALRLPQTELTIHAREIIFEDVGVLKASINTTPYAAPQKAGPGGSRNVDPAEHGAPAGNVSLLAEKVTYLAGNDLRIIANGGNGAPATPGRNGANGGAVANDQTCNNPEYPFVSLIVRWSDGFNADGNNPNLWPNIDVGRSETRRICEGEDAVPPSPPGNGGNGGTVRSIVDISPNVQVNGGNAGALGSPTQGGQRWRELIYILRGCIGNANHGFEQLFLANGDPGPAPAAVIPVGSKGSFAAETNALAWLSDYQIAVLSVYQEILFDAGRFKDAHDLLTEYLAFYAQYQPLDSTLQALLDEMERQLFDLEAFKPIVQILLDGFPTNSAFMTTTQALALVPTLTTQQFDALDKNADGRLTKTELSEAVADFALIGLSGTCEISLSPGNNDVDSGAGTIQFTIVSNGAWIASTNQTWATLSSTSGTGDASVTVTYGANSGAVARSAVLTVNRADCTGDSSTAVLQQAAAAATTITLSGRVTNQVSGAGEAGVTLAITGVTPNPVTNAQGNWTAAVPKNTAVKVTPSKNGFTFSPASRDVPASNTNVSNLAFVAVPVSVPGSVKLSGTIRATNGAPIANATVTASNGGQSGTTNAQGEYIVTVPSGWSGSLTPTKANHTFTPAVQTLNTQVSDTNGIDFVGNNAATAITISGRVTSAGTGLDGAEVIVVGNPSIGTTADAQGNYILRVDAPFTGSIIAVQPKYTFTPIAFSGLTADSPNSNFAGTAVASAQTLTITGRVTLSSNGAGLSAVTVSSSSGQTATTASDGSYSLEVPKPFTGTLVSLRSGFTFAPATLTLTAQNDTSGQDFVATAAPAQDSVTLQRSFSPAGPYAAGAKITVSLTVKNNATQPVTAWGIQEDLPVGWGVSGTGSGGQVVTLPGAGQVNRVEITATTPIPAGQTASATYTLTVAQNVTAGSRHPIVGRVLYRFNGAQQQSDENISTLTIQGQPSVPTVPANSIWGRVTSQTRPGFPIERATVVITFYSKVVVPGQTTTDSNGEFRFDDLPPDELNQGFELNVTRDPLYRGANTNELKFGPIQKGQYVEIELKPSGIKNPTLAPTVKSTPSSGQISWRANPEVDILGYQVYRRPAGTTGGGTIVSLNQARPNDVYAAIVPVVSFEDFSITAGNGYEYAYKALRENYRFSTLSPWSEAVTCGQIRVIFPKIGVDLSSAYAGLDLWQRPSNDPNEDLYIRIPIIAESTYEVAAEPMQLFGTLPRNVIDSLEMAPTEDLPNALAVYSSDITAAAGVKLAGILIDDGADKWRFTIYVTNSLGKSTTLLGRGELCYLKAKLKVLGTAATGNLLLEGGVNGTTLYEPIDPSTPTNQNELDIELVNGEIRLSASTCLRGDANGDRVINKTDLAENLKVVVDRKRYEDVKSNPALLACFDVNNDGDITAEDYGRIEKWFDRIGFIPPRGFDNTKAAAQPGDELPIEFRLYKFLEERFKGDVRPQYAVTAVSVTNARGASTLSFTLNYPYREGLPDGTVSFSDVEDPQQLLQTSHLPAGTTVARSVAQDAQGNGSVTLVFSLPTPLESNDEILVTQLRFRSGQGVDEEPINVEDIPFKLVEPGAGSAFGKKFQFRDPKAPVVVEIASGREFGDFNDDGEVDILDFNLLILGWGNTYKIEDFNALILNWGKTL